MASTEDGEPAFLLAADLGEARQGKAVVAPPEDSAAGAATLPDTVAGHAKVVTTSSIEVNGQALTLAVVNGEGDNYAAQLQKIIDGQGGELHCVRADQGYQCTLHSGTDVAVLALLNGSARPTPDAPANYQEQAKSAQAARRGVWATGR